MAKKNDKIVDMNELKDNNEGENTEEVIVQENTVWETLKKFGKKAGKITLKVLSYVATAAAAVIATKLLSRDDDDDDANDNDDSTEDNSDNE